MKPLKSGKTVANWLLRIALAAILYHLYFVPASTLNFTNSAFLIAFAALSFGALVMIGGILSKPTLTILSGFVIMAISAYKIAISFNGFHDFDWGFHLVPFAIGFYFITNGNDK